MPSPGMPKERSGTASKAADTEPKQVWFPTSENFLNDFIQGVTEHRQVVRGDDPLMILHQSDLLGFDKTP